MRTADVDGLLEQISPEQFAEWCAFYRWEEIQNERRMAQLLSALTNFGWLVASSHGMRVDAQYFKGPDDFLDEDAKLGGESGARGPRLSAQESELLAAQQYGKR